MIKVISLDYLTNNVRLSKPKIFKRLNIYNVSIYSDVNKKIVLQYHNIMP